MKIMPYFIYNFLMFFFSAGLWLRNLKWWPSFLDMRLVYPKWIFSIWLLARNEYKVNFVIAQARLEGGTSDLATKYNNLFGITYAASKYNSGHILMKDTLSNQMMNFAVYKNPTQCVYDYFFYVKKTNSWCGKFLDNVPSVDFIADSDIAKTYYRNTAYGYRFYGHYYTASAVDYGQSIVNLSETNRSWKKGFNFIVYSSFVIWLLIIWFISFFVGKVNFHRKEANKSGYVRKKAKGVYKKIKSSFRKR